MSISLSCGSEICRFVALSRIVQNCESMIRPFTTVNSVSELVIRQCVRTSRCAKVSRDVLQILQSTGRLCPIRLCESIAGTWACALHISILQTLVAWQRGFAKAKEERERVQSYASGPKFVEVGWLVGVH